MKSNGNGTIVANGEQSNIQEISNLKAEIAALRTQIDNLQVRGNELMLSNRELQKQVHLLKNHNQELENLQKQKDDLFAMVVHDIKNPAGLIKSLVELLNSYDLSASEQKEVIADIVETTMKIINLSKEVTRVLSVECGRLKLDMQPFPMNMIIEDLFRVNKATADEKQISLYTDLQDEMPDVTADPQKITEIIDNLISNAIKFTQYGGKVLVRSKSDATKVYVEVSDNGPGISEDDIKVAFEKGSRLSAKPTGGESSTGLGLWIIKKLVEAHNGKVMIRSSVGKGATFFFWIPLNPPEQTE